jgi:hypothetical protein
MSLHQIARLSKQAIKEFKIIYKEEFKEDLTDDEVEEIANQLLRFFGLLVFRRE